VRLAEISRFVFPPKRTQVESTQSIGKLHAKQPLLDAGRPTNVSFLAGRTLESSQNDYPARPADQAGDAMRPSRWSFVLLLCAGFAQAQPDPVPVNDLPNPYKTAAPWGSLPDGRSWGTLSAVAIDHDGESVWVAYRYGTNPNPPPGRHRGGCEGKYLRR
jgi:hypothetical protein